MIGRDVPFPEDDCVASPYLTSMSAGRVRGFTPDDFASARARGQGVMVMQEYTIRDSRGRVIKTVKLERGIH